MFTGLWYTLTPCCLNVFDSLSDKPCTYGRPMEGSLVLPLLTVVGSFRLLFRDHKCPFRVAVRAKGIMHMFELTFLIFGSGDKLFCSVC